MAGLLVGASLARAGDVGSAEASKDLGIGVSEPRAPGEADAGTQPTSSAASPASSPEGASLALLALLLAPPPGRGRASARPAPERL